MFCKNDLCMKAMDKLNNDKDLSASIKYLYTRIFCLAQKHGYCYASTECFANWCNVSTRSIELWIVQLENMGYIKREIGKFNLGKLSFKRKIFICGYDFESESDVQQDTDTDTKPQTVLESIVAYSKSDPYIATAEEIRQTQNDIRTSKEYKSVLQMLVEDIKSELNPDKSNDKCHCGRHCHGAVDNAEGENWRGEGENWRGEGENWRGEGENWRNENCCSQSAKFVDNTEQNGCKLSPFSAKRKEDKKLLSNEYPPTPHRGDREPVSVIVSKNYMPLFDKFMEVYPRANNRQEAQRLWKTNKLDRFADEIIAAVIEQKQNNAQWRRDNGRYIPYPSKWLRNEGWKDKNYERVDRYNLSCGGMSQNQGYSYNNYSNPMQLSKPGKAEMEALERQRKKIEERQNDNLTPEERREKALAKLRQFDYDPNMRDDEGYYAKL